MVISNTMFWSIISGVAAFTLALLLTGLCTFIARHASYEVEQRLTKLGSWLIWVGTWLLIQSFWPTDMNMWLQVIASTIVTWLVLGGELPSFEKKQPQQQRQERYTFRIHLDDRDHTPYV